MAAVTSLGLHQPTGLQHAIQERFLPADPASTSYSWHNHFNSDSDSNIHDDELLVTPRCVIWSRGGIFRKSYNFDLENEPVAQALLTQFPSVRPLDTSSSKSGQHASSDSRSAAIVVFLKTQAHVYFLTGTSHVIHLPFEVEFACAAPNGLIIQRKLRAEIAVASSLKFPRVPPPSFVSSQPQPFSAASSQQSVFSIADLGAPKQMPNSTLKDLWDPPALRNDSNWPRLFALSDPLSEMGLVVAQSHKPESRGHRRSSTKITSLDTAEEILHVSQRGDFDQGSENPLVLALTLNRETSQYTVWKLVYIGHESIGGEKRRVPSGTSGTMSRRRSSFVPGASATGATTPVPGQQTMRESLGGNTLGVGKKGLKQDQTARDKHIDFASSLDPDYEISKIPRRKSRRVSSMLARADLSASHERSAFSDLATVHQHTTAKRGESLGNQHARLSFPVVNGQSFTQNQQFNQSINSLLEAPVDDLLDELRAGGDFEGFHNMGLDDAEFDALSNEIMFTKVCSVAAEHSNLRYSSQHLPAQSQCKIFTLTAPTSSEDQKGKEIVICVLDPDEKRLLVMTLYMKSHKAARIDHGVHLEAEKDVTVVKLGPVMRANNVIDACRLDDGQISRILVLTETSDGYGELSLQAPWSVLMKVALPDKFAISNIRDLGHNVVPRAKREGSLKRVLSKSPRALRGLRNSKPRGFVDLVDDEGKMHQLHILLQPRNPLVCKVLEVCRAVVPGLAGGEGILVAWWHVMQWLRTGSIDVVDLEWSALVITLFSMVLVLNPKSNRVQNRTHTKRKSRTGFLRSSSGAQEDSSSWEAMQSQEAWNGNPAPPWFSNNGWKWLAEQGLDSWTNKDPESPTSPGLPIDDDKGGFIQKHVKFARLFISNVDQSLISACFPSSASRNSETRVSALVDVFVGLHLLREEQRLDIMTSDFFSSGLPSLSPILAQIARWLGWRTWVNAYDVEEVSMFSVDYNQESPLEFHIPEPFQCPSIYGWIQSCLTTKSLVPFLTLPSIVANRSETLTKYTQNLHHWHKLTPRTLLFVQFFSLLRPDWSAAQFVEGLSSAGMDPQFMETLPEAIHAPLQEAIVECQTNPFPTWSKELLAMVGREDVNILLSPGQRPRHTQSTLLVCLCYNLFFSH